MTLHIFNPEHDIALASGLANFTPPHAGRQLRRDLGFIPALWAAEGDTLIVDDVETAERGVQRLRRQLCREQSHALPPVKLCLASSKAMLCSDDISTVAPWGWDSALRARLLRLGIGEQLLPKEEQITVIKQLSHRRTAMQLLPLLRTEGTVGEAFECRTFEETADVVSRFDSVVLKAPWSSSGRGLRFVAKSLDGKQEGWQRHSFDANQEGWLRNLLSKQGSVMVEPLYNKVKDFAMEFSCNGDGRVSYEGLSLFHTQNGAYTGNILATESAKCEALSRYLPTALLQHVQTTICNRLSCVLKGHYAGPFGVDMMVVSHPRTDGFLLHPCVEINLRRTMGHVALALTRMVNPTNDGDIRRVMRVTYSDIYQLDIQRL